MTAARGLFVRVAVVGCCLCLTLACGRQNVLIGPGGVDDASADAQTKDTRPADAGTDVKRPSSVDAGMEVAAALDASDGPKDVASVVDAADAADLRPDTVVPPTCPVDCAHLPNVQPGTAVACVAGLCMVPPGSCVPGFAHCSTNPNDGCESDLSSPATCDSCFVRCPSYLPACVLQSTGSRACGPSCSAAFPNACYYSCVDFQTDNFNCGACGNSCYLPNATATCMHGQCALLGCSDPGWADCTAAPGCETPLGTNDNCSACGDKACAIANTVFTCSSDNACAGALCAPGFANCSTANPDCETAFAAGGTCLPSYLGTTPFATLTFNDEALAIGSDGSTFLGGEFSGTVDFDPTAGQDIHIASDDMDGYITKINADGSYAWTRTFAGRGAIGVRALAAAAGGAVVAAGYYNDSVDLDPGAGVDLHQTASAFAQDPFVVKLAADGTLVWGRTFAGVSGSSSGNVANGVAVDAADSVYVVGAYQDTVDFDPGAGTALHTASFMTGMVVKLTSGGAFSWVQALDNGQCSDSLSAVTVASDGSIWTAGGVSTGSTCTLDPVPDNGFSSDDALIAAFGAAGDARGTWTVGGPGWDTANAIAGGSDGSIYVGGATFGTVDFDPGPGVANRWLGQQTGGFILKIAADASFRWVQVVPTISIVSLAASADGGVLAAGATAGAFVTKLAADGTAAWSFVAGSDATSAATIAARGSAFALSGLHSGSADFNPGAGLDIVFGDITFLSRYSF